MKLIAPDDPAALPGWLDRVVTGPEPVALVAALEAAHGPGTGSIL